MLCYALLVFSGRQNLKPPGALSRFSRVRLRDSINCSPPRLLCPWDSPGKNTGGGCYELLQKKTAWRDHSKHQVCVRRQALSLTVPLSLRSGTTTWQNDLASLEPCSPTIRHLYKHVCMCPPGVALQMSTAALRAISQVLEPNPGFINTRRNSHTIAYYPVVKNTWITTTRTHFTRWWF